MKYIEIAEIFEKIEGISSRNEMVALIAESYKNSTNEDAQIFSYLIEGRVAPQFVRSEFSFSEKSLINLFSAYCKTKNIKIDVAKERQISGDIGLTVMTIREAELSDVSQSNADGSSISQPVVQTKLSDTYDTLWAIVNTSGTGSINRKGEIFLKAYQSMTPLEAKFFARIVCGKLRMGCNVKTLLDALSVCVSSDKSLRELLDNAYGFATDVGYIANLVKTSTDIEKLRLKLAEITPTVGIPIFPRLVDRVAGFDEAFEKLNGHFYVEPKYDGVRCQIHKGVDYESEEYEERVWPNMLTTEIPMESDMFGTQPQQVPTNNINELFSRNLEDFSNMFPEILESVEKLKCEKCIIDCEIVGVGKNGFLSFQETMTRRRKYEIEKSRESIPVKAFAFDLLYLDGEDISKQDYEKRKEILQNLIKNSVDQNKPESLADVENIISAPSHLVTTRPVLQKLFEKYVNEGYEGIILKQPTGKYQPGVRNLEWIKLKKSLEQEHVDTFDLVILGYYSGSGKQTKFNMGAILGGVYNTETGMFEPITKIGTGITEELWKEISGRLEEIKLNAKPISVEIGDYPTPDVWVNPEIVVTIDADEISKSKIYGVGKKQLGFGLALRFPRMIDFGRDKLAEDCTSVEEAVAMYKMRKEKGEK